MDVVFEGKRIRVEAGKAKLPNGRVVYKEVVRHPGAVVVLPLIKAEDGKELIVMVRQYRYPVDEWIYELPAGTIERGEDPARTALRELLEETGYRADTLVKLVSFYTTPGISDEVMHAFLATGLVKEEQSLEEDELLTVEHVELERVLEMIKSNKIKDGKTIATILYYTMFVRREGSER